MRVCDKITLPRVPDISRPSLEALSYVLRRRELWPAGFTWDFRHNCGCGMGMAQRMWCDKDLLAVTDLLQIPSRVAVKLFTMRGYIGRSDLSGCAVTPEMVADKIDAYLGKE